MIYYNIKVWHVQADLSFGVLRLQGRAYTIWSGHEFTTSRPESNAQPPKTYQPSAILKTTGLSDFRLLATQLRIGNRSIAHHKKWGDGTVLEVTGSGKILGT